MRALMRAGALAAILLLFAAPAAAHVTIEPPEAIAGTFARLVVRVPGEEPNAATRRIEIELPPLAFVSFEPTPGWKRTTEMRTLDKPIRAFGQEISEVVGTVTWTGGSIAVGEFEDFGFTARMPDDERTLKFRAFQMYDSGKVVQWVGPPDSDEPAALLTTYDIGAGEGEGELAVLDRVVDRIESLEDDDGGGGLGTILGAGGIILGAAALAVALRGRAP